MHMLQKISFAIPSVVLITDKRVNTNYSKSENGGLSKWAVDVLKILIFLNIKEQNDENDGPFYIQREEIPKMLGNENITGNCIDQIIKELGHHLATRA